MQVTLCRTIKKLRGGHGGQRDSAGRRGRIQRRIRGIRHLQNCLLEVVVTPIPIALKSPPPPCGEDDTISPQGTAARIDRSPRHAAAVPVSPDTRPHSLLLLLGRKSRNVPRQTDGGGKSKTFFSDQYNTARGRRSRETRTHPASRLAPPVCPKRKKENGTRLREAGWSTGALRPGTAIYYEGGAGAGYFRRTNPASNGQFEERRAGWRRPVLSLSLATNSALSLTPCVPISLSLTFSLPPPLPPEFLLAGRNLAPVSPKTSAI